MYITVWTLSPSKCIFKGQVDSVPRVGELVVIKGKMQEKVLLVNHLLKENTIEILVDCTDSTNEYGDCLYFK